MSGAGRVGVDSAGGTITGALVPKFKIEGSAAVLVGASIAAHGSSPHDAPVMVQGSSKFKVGGIPICRAGDLSSCGDALAPGSSKFKINT